MKTWSYIIFIFLLLGIFYLGYWIRPRLDPCPQPEADTVVVIDTVTREIPSYVPYYVTRTDSVIYRDTIFQDQQVDTAEILRRYYALHYYTREFTDSLLWVQMNDAVTENRIIDTKFNYRINRPQQIIHNVTQVSGSTSAIYAGLSFPVYGQPDKFHVNLEATYAGPSFLFGAGYDFNYKTFNARFGIPLIRFSR